MEYEAPQFAWYDSRQRLFIQKQLPEHTNAVTLFPALLLNLLIELKWSRTSFLES